MGQKSLTAIDHDSRMEGVGLLLQILRGGGWGWGEISERPTTRGTIPTWENNHVSLSMSASYLAKFPVLRHLFTSLHLL